MSKLHQFLRTGSRALVYYDWHSRENKPKPERGGVMFEAKIKINNGGESGYCDGCSYAELRIEAARSYCNLFRRGGVPTHLNLNPQGYLVRCKACLDAEKESLQNQHEEVANPISPIRLSDLDSGDELDWEFELNTPSAASVGTIKLSLKHRKQKP